MLVRVRTKTGTWRLEVPGPQATIQEVMHAIAADKGLGVEHQTLFPITLPASSDPAGAKILGGATTLEANGLGSNGAMLYLTVDGVELVSTASTADETMRGAPRRKIGADGSIVETKYEDYTSVKGDIKKQWTLTQFLEMDEAFNFKIKRQEDANCNAVSLDSEACVAFQTYLQQLGWRQARCAYLYGSFEADDSVRVEAVYEPPQEATAEGSELLEDPQEAAVAHLASLLGLQRVGWIFAHPPREEGFVFSGAEAIRAALLQLEAADGVAKTPFVSVRVTVTERGEANFEAYQASVQCMAMVAEGALDVDPEDHAACAVHPTFTAVVEGKRAASVNTNFFLCNVPVKQHSSKTFVARFPKENRAIALTRQDVAARIKAVKAQGKPLVEALADFSLLAYLATFPQIFDPQSFMPALCNSVVDRTVPLDDGYALILYSFAGIDF